MRKVWFIIANTLKKTDKNSLSDYKKNAAGKIANEILNANEILKKTDKKRDLMISKIPFFLIFAQDVKTDFLQAGGNRPV